jgi:hypothetical protein
MEPDRPLPNTACGCYQCQRIFTFQDISEWWDEGEVPVCPHCGIDSVVIETIDMNVTPERLFAMKKTYF